MCATNFINELVQSIKFNSEVHIYHCSKPIVAKHAIKYR